ncbi:MAG: preprotein translocase subunit YajC [Endomicrobium sp.]|uniref:preprotein translocase subunit YajC n=1 Tax=Candidatus Endomicrobiellum pyrsonymphae TaxID=1408203 RepID=UPI00358CD6C0|nr:preprotein translocase subunit YajC [Endomicrobium sp.]
MRKSVDLLVFLVAVLLTPSFAFAQSGSGGMSFGGFGLVPLLLIFVFFYLFMLRPQQKKAKDHQKLLNSLKKDDRVITVGGIYATVSSVKGNIIEVKISDGVCIQVARQSVASVITKEKEAEEATVKIPEIVKR